MFSFPVMGQLGHEMGKVWADRFPEMREIQEMHIQVLL
jgi:hypothetical protein